MNRLNFGSGYDIREGWTNVDKLDYGPGTLVADVLEGLPFPNEHFDCIVANHSLQMLDYNELPVVLAELRRVLKVGGVLRVLVPDLNKALAAWQGNRRDWFPIADELEHTIDGKFARYVLWHGHTRSCFTRRSLQDKLLHEGFQNVVEVSYHRSFHSWERLGEPAPITELDSRENESLIVEAIR